MKKIILIVPIVLAFNLNNKLHAQSDSTITDTAAYINQIITGTNKYIGKSFSVLENDLKLQIQSISGIPSQYANIEYATFFYFSKVIFDPELIMPNYGLLIYWQNPYNDLRLSDSLSKEGSEWNPETDSLYRSGTYIIKRIDPHY